MPKQKRAAPAREERIAQARLLYDAGVAPVAEIAKLLGMSAGQFHAFRRANGWPMRASPIKRRDDEAPPGAIDQPQKDEAAAEQKAKRASAPSTSLIQRLEEAVEREFAEVESALSSRTGRNVETSARALASLVRTLAELKRMKRETLDGAGAREDDGRDDEHDDPPPRQLAELRAELARRLERLRGEGQAR